MFAAFGAFAQIKLGVDGNASVPLSSDGIELYGVSPEFSLFLDFPIYDKIYGSVNLDYKLGSFHVNGMHSSTVGSYNFFEGYIDGGYSFDFSPELSLALELGAGLYIQNYSIYNLVDSNQNLIINAQTKLYYNLPLNISLYLKARYFYLKELYGFGSFGAGFCWRFNN